MEELKKLMEELKKQVKCNEDSINFLESGLNLQHSNLKFLFRAVSIWPRNDNALERASPHMIEECKILATMYCNAAASIQDRIMEFQTFTMKFLQISDEMETTVPSLCLTETEKTHIREFNSFLSEFNEQICFNTQFYTQFIENYV